MTNPFAAMAAAALVGSGLLVDRDGFVSEADREASLFLMGQNVHLSPAAREIVEHTLRREGPVFVGLDLARDKPRERYTPPETKPRKFKHNRRG